MIGLQVNGPDMSVEQIYVVKSNEVANGQLMIETPPVKAVCFDWGNTIQMGKPGIVETITHMWLKFYPGISRAEIIEAAQTAWCDLVKLRPTRKDLVDPVTFREKLWAKQAELMGKVIGFNSKIPDWPWVANAFFRDHYNSNRSWSVPADHARLLYKLKQARFPMAVIANDDDSAPLPRTISELGLTGYFETEIASSTFGKNKPHSSTYLAALSCLDLRADEVLFVGDDFHNDYWGPLQVGMNPVLFDPDGLYAKVDGIERITSLGDVLKYLPKNLVKS